VDACGIGGIAPLVLIVALEGGDSFSRLGLVTQGTSPDTHGIGRWVGPIVGPNALEMRNCLPRNCSRPPFLPCSGALPGHYTD
jgi:hypothetical protein